MSIFNIPNQITKRIIRRFFWLFGFEIRRIPTPSLCDSKLANELAQSSGSDQHTSVSPPYVIELLGPSGIGKSSLLRTMADGITALDLWEPIVYRQNLGSLLLSDHALYKGLFDFKLAELSKTELSVERKMALIAYFLRILRMHQKLKALSGRNAFVLDEGIFHNFLRELCLLIDDRTWRNCHEAEILHRTAIVFCCSSPEIVVKRIRKRQRERNYVMPEHQGRSSEALLRMIESEFKEQKAFIQLLGKLGVPCLEISMEEGLKPNAAKVACWINALLSSSLNESACPPVASDPPATPAADYYSG